MEIVTCYTDGSKVNNSTGAGIFCEKIEIAVSRHLGNFATVFQAEVTAITEASQYLLQKRVKNKDIVILSDSQAALKSLTANTVRQKTVFECIQILNKLSSDNNLTLKWVPGHVGVRGNERADVLAKNGTSIRADGPIPALPIAMAEVRRALNEWSKRAHYRAWNRLDICRHLRELQIQEYLKVAKWMKNLDRPSLTSSVI